MSKISIVIPVKNESKNVSILSKEIMKSCKSFNYEVLFINDGSNDDTIVKLNSLKKIDNKIRIIDHHVSLGQSAAIRSGVLKANNEIIITMDGDCQNDPSDIPLLLSKFESKKSQLLLIGGVRRKRMDNFSKRFGSKFARYVRKIILGDDHPDSGCGLKIFHKKLFIMMPYFDHMHRYLTALAKREGAEVLKMDVNHRPRFDGNSNYTNIGRLLEGITDVFGVFWLLKRSTLNLNSKGKK